MAHVPCSATGQLASTLQEHEEAERLRIQQEKEEALSSSEHLNGFAEGHCKWRIDGHIRKVRERERERERWRGSREAERKRKEEDEAASRKESDEASRPAGCQRVGRQGSSPAPTVSARSLAGRRAETHADKQK